LHIVSLILVHPVYPKYFGKAKTSVHTHRYAVPPRQRGTVLGACPSVPQSPVYCPKIPLSSQGGFH